MERLQAIVPAGFSDDKDQIRWFKQYFSQLSQEAWDNIGKIIDRLVEKGITNKYSIAAILSVLSKESGFIPKSENSYSNTTVKRIRAVFGSRFSKMTDSQINDLKKDPEAFFNFVYANQNGNDEKNGFKYRGRGLNQITFFNTYKKIGAQIGVDLVNEPDNLNQLDVATDAVIQYFKNFFMAMPKQWANHYGTNNINGFSKLDVAVKCMYHANAGWGRTLAYLEADKTGGRKKALDRSQTFLAAVEQKLAK